MNKFLLLCPTLAFVIFLSCKNDSKRDIRSFYFPIEELAEGKVYEYQSLDFKNKYSEYWYFRSLETDTGTFLVGTFYDSNFQVGQVLREKIVANGSLAKDLFLYEPDYQAGKQVPIQATIESPNVFPFKVSDSSGVFLYKLFYQLPGDTVGQVYLIRNRRFAGNAEDFFFREKKHPCLKFSVREVVGHKAVGNAEAEASGEEWYAQNIGLVRFRKKYGSGEALTVRDFRLIDIYPMSELEKKAQAEETSEE